MRANDYGTFQQQRETKPDAPAGTRTYDLAPMFDAGGGGFGNDTYSAQLYGKNAGSLGGNAFSYNPDPSGSQDIFSRPASELAAQARARLAEFMGGASPETTAETTKAVENTPPVVAKTELPAEPPVAPPEPSMRDFQSPANDYSIFQQPSSVSAGGGEPPVPLPVPRPAAAGEGERQVYQDPNAPRPPEDIPDFPAARFARNGKEPEAFVVHHTSGRGEPADIVNYWRRERPGIGTQYIMDRNGVIHDVAKELGYTGTDQAAHITKQGAKGLDNDNVVGMEIIAKDDSDVTASQIASLKQFAEARYPNTPFYGRGEMSTNKEANEGYTGANAILDARVEAGKGLFPSSPDFWDQAAKGPAASAAPPPSFSSADSQGPTMPAWQASVSPAQRNPEVIAALQTQADRFGIPVESIPAVLGLETGGTWNPLTNAPKNPNYGVAQLAPGDFKTAGGTLGGLTYDQYRRASVAQQITAYGDFIASSPNAAYLDYASGDPALTAAILQAIQFSPQGMGWSEALLAGNTGVPTASNPSEQAREVRPTTIDAMRNAFA